MLEDVKLVSYKERAAHYQFEYVDSADAEFLYSRITPETRKILEIPSGAGRNVMNIARSGRRIVAVDREPEMVKALRQRIKSVDQPCLVEPIVGDLCSLALGETFDLVLVPREAFQLVVDLESAGLALKSLGQHLDQDGKLIIDLSPFQSAPNAPPGLRPDYYDPALGDGVWKADWQRNIGDATTMARYHQQSHVGPDRLDIVFQYEVAKDGKTTNSQATTRFRVYTFEEFKSLVSRSDLMILACYGNYDEKPFQPGDPRMIFVLGRVGGTSDEQSTSIAPGSSADFALGFSNQKQAFEISDLGVLIPQLTHMRYFEKYSANYFSGPFLEGQGAENILTAIHEFGRPGHALDLGSGTSTLFWYLASQGVESISCSDIVPEALIVLDGFKNLAAVPACFDWVLRHFHLSRFHLKSVQDALGPYLVFDTLAPWPVWMDDRTYQFVTAFGCFSLSADEKAYAENFLRVASSLESEGIFIGADWIRSSELQSRSDHKNLFVSEKLVRSSISSAGLRTIQANTIEIKGDPYYQAVILWVAEKP